MKPATTRIKLPPLLQHRARALGDEGERWLANVGDLVNGIAGNWQLSIEAQISGGTEALVFAVARAGERAVLKIGLPRSLGNEAYALQLANGLGYARLLAFDAGRDAMLLERLGERLADSGFALQRQIEIICATLQRAWRAVEHTGPLTTGAQQAQRQAHFIRSQWATLRLSCAVAVKERALDYAVAREAAFDAARSVLVHGDAHIWNTLRVPGQSAMEPDSYKLVDPDGLFAEPALDLAISLREWRGELLAGDTLALGRQRCALLARLTGVDSTAIWQWAFIEHVSCGLLDLQLRDVENADQHFAIAQRWLGQ